MGLNRVEIYSRGGPYSKSTLFKWPYSRGLYYKQGPYLGMEAWSRVALFKDPYSLGSFFQEKPKGLFK